MYLLKRVDMSGCFSYVYVLLVVFPWAVLTEHRVQLGMWLLLEGHIAYIFKDCELSCESDSDL